MAFDARWVPAYAVRQGKYKTITLATGFPSRLTTTAGGLNFLRDVVTSRKA
jgi:hypothetical protein